jgi:predicted dehydrogenase
MNILMYGTGAMAKRRVANLEAMCSRLRITFHDPLKNYHAPSFSGYDAVFVCSPPETHLDYVNDALLAKQPVFVEKPFVLPSEVDDARRLVKLAFDIEVPLMVGHNLLWTDAFDDFESQRLWYGAPLYYEGRFGYNLREWGHDQNRRLPTGGIALDCIQDLAIATEMLGQPNVTNFREEYLSDIANEWDADWAQLCLQFPDNVTGTLTMDAVRSDRTRLHQIVCEEGTATLDLSTKDASDVVKSYEREVSAFLTWVEGGLPGRWPNPIVSLETLRLAGVGA